MCRTLFLTRLHNKDLWQLWRFFTKGQTDVPLTLGQTRHLLSLLSEGEGPEKLDDLARRADANGNGAFEFDEFAVLLRAINPQARARVRVRVRVRVRARVGVRVRVRVRVRVSASDHRQP